MINRLTALNIFVVRNSFLSISIAFVGSGFELQPKPIIISTHMRNTYPMRSRNDISGKSTSIRNESTNVPMAAAMAPRALARFQKKPTKNMAKAPGLTKPVNSWINWNAWSRLPSNGAMNTAIIKLIMPNKRPTFTNLASEDFGEIYSL